MTEDQLVIQFLTAISNQSDVLVAMSVAGLAGVYVTFIRPHLSTYRPILFSLLLVLFLLGMSIFFGYVTDAAISGYFYEMVHHERGTMSGAALAWLTVEKYPVVFQYLAIAQISAGVIGSLWLAVLWFRIYRRQKTSQGEQTGG